MKHQPHNIVLLQLQSNSSYQDNLECLVAYLKSNKGKDLIIAPEVYLTAYDYKNFEEAIFFYDIAIETLLPLVSTEIFIFTIIKREGDRVVNKAVVLHNHKIFYQQNKYKLFRLGDEHHYFEAGEQGKIQPFSINGIKYAILICFELRFKDLWKQIEGVDIILIPAMWGKPRKNHLEVLSQALAIMNQSFVLVCNSANEDMAKSSAIISPWGEVTMDDESEIIEATIDLKKVKKSRRLIPMYFKVGHNLP